MNGQQEKDDDQIIAEMQVFRQTMKDHFGEEGYQAKLAPYIAHLQEHQRNFPDKSLFRITFAILSKLEQRVCATEAEQDQVELNKALYGLAMVELEGGDQLIKLLTE